MRKASFWEHEDDPKLGLYASETAMPKSVKIDCRLDTTMGDLEDDAVCISAELGEDIAASSNLMVIGDSDLK